MQHVRMTSIVVSLVFQVLLNSENSDDLHSCNNSPWFNEECFEKEKVTLKLSKFVQKQ